MSSVTTTPETVTTTTVTTTAAGTPTQVSSGSVQSNGQHLWNVNSGFKADTRTTFSKESNLFDLCNLNLYDKKVRTMSDFQEIKERMRYLPQCMIKAASICGPKTVWAHWSKRMMSDLRYFELATLIEDEWDATVQADSYYHRMQMIARDQIELNVEDGIAKIIGKEPTVKLMWKKLEQLITGSGINKSIMLTTKLLKIVQSQVDLQTYTTDMDALITEFGRAYPTIPDEYWIGLFVGCLPDDHLRSSLMLYPELTLAKAMESAIQEYQFKANRGDQMLSSCAIGFQKTGYKQDNRQVNRKPQQPQQASSSGGQQQKDQQQKSCTYCKKAGHWSRYCKQKKADKKKNSNNNQSNGSARENGSDNRQSATNQGLTCANLRICSVRLFRAESNCAESEPEESGESELEVRPEASQPERESEMISESFESESIEPLTVEEICEDESGDVLYGIVSEPESDSECEDRGEIVRSEFESVRERKSEPESNRDGERECEREP